MKKYFASIITTALLLVACEKSDKVTSETNNQNKPVDSAIVAETPVKQNSEVSVQDSMLAAQKQIKFETLAFPAKKKDSVMGQFMKNYSEDERYTILALNRLDSKNRWRADSLVIPNKIESNFLAYSPFPLQVDSLAQVKKLAMFSYQIHAYGIYENGKLVKWGPSSLGKKSTPTKKGLMFTNWKKEVAISTSNTEWKLRWNFNIHNTMGIGWHQYDLPGHHASHSCLRLLENDAKWLYDWADMWVLSKDANTVVAKGTPVIVFGESNFKDRPWLRLAQDPTANTYKAQDISNVVSEHLSEILKEQENSEKVRAEKEKEKLMSAQEKQKSNAKSAA